MADDALTYFLDMKVRLDKGSVSGAHSEVQSAIDRLPLIKVKIAFDIGDAIRDVEKRLGGLTLGPSARSGSRPPSPGRVIPSQLSAPRAKPPKRRTPALR